MSRGLRRSLSTGLLVGLLAVIVVALLPRPQPPTTDERVHEIASHIKCPSCNGASIADAQSSVARDLLVVIREQVDAGLSDQDVYDYFVARYSEAALLSPPTRGWGLWLWLLPIAGLGVGGAVVARRRQRGVRVEGRSRRSLSDEVDAAAADLVDVDAQLMSGELDEGTAAGLRERYRHEIALLEEELTGKAEVATETGRDRRRMLAGGAFLAAGLLAVGLTVGFAVRDRAAGSPITGDIVQSAAEQGAVNLDEVSDEEMEEVVARFPDNIPMRRALARRYFFAGEFDKAFDHYFAVLEDGPDPEALANVGWITYVSSDEVETALSLVERSLEIEPENPMAYWFLANIRFGGLGDAAGALEPLERFLTYPNVPEELRLEARTLLDRAEDAA